MLHVFFTIVNIKDDRSQQKMIFTPSDLSINIPDTIEYDNYSTFFDLLSTYPSKAELNELLETIFQTTNIASKKGMYSS